MCLAVATDSKIRKLQRNQWKIKMKRKTKWSVFLLDQQVPIFLRIFFNQCKAVVKILPLKLVGQLSPERSVATSKKQLNKHFLFQIMQNASKVFAPLFYPSVISFLINSSFSASSSSNFCNTFMLAIFEQCEITAVKKRPHSLLKLLFQILSFAATELLT